MRVFAAEGSGVVIVVIILALLLLAVLGSLIYFLHKKGKIPCGRSGKQEITKEMLSKDDIVVELQAEPKTEQAVLLKGVNGGQKTPAGHQDSACLADHHQHPPRPAPLLGSPGQVTWWLWVPVPESRGEEDRGQRCSYT
ncbi:hypothetical protein CRUP_002141, partial [Coryphaenoides rupestris]